MAYLDEVNADSPYYSWGFTDLSYFWDSSEYVLVDGLLGPNSAVHGRQWAALGGQTGTGEGSPFQALGPWTAELVIKTPPTDEFDQTVLSFQARKAERRLMIKLLAGGRIGMYLGSAISLWSDLGRWQPDEWCTITYRHDGAGTLSAFYRGLPCGSANGALGGLSDGSYTGPSRDMIYFVGHHDVFTPGDYANGATSESYLTIDHISFYAHALTDERIFVHAVAAGVATISTPVSARTYLKVDTRTRPRARTYLKANISAPVSARTYLKVNTAQVRARTYLMVSTRTSVGASAPRCYLKVDTATDLSIAQRPGVVWALRVLIDGVDQTHLLTGAVRTNWSAGKNRVATFELMPESGVLDPADFDRKPVVIEYRDHAYPGGPVQFARVRYSGTISGVRWIAARGILACNATSNSDARFRHMATEVIEREIPGQWSQYVFSPSTRGWDRVRDLLETLQADVWFNADGGVMLKPWVSAAPDVEWTDADVLPDSLVHDPVQRSRITNRIEVRMDYRFERLRQRMLRCHWSTGVTWCERLLHPFPLCQRSMIETAAKGKGGWQVIGDVSFAPVPGPGGYRCFPFGANSAQKYLLWGGDADQAWAWQAWWTVGRRWGQQITEHHVAEVVAQTSVDTNGVLEQLDEYGVQSERDNSAWLAEQGYSSAGDLGFVVAGSIASASDGKGVVLGDQVVDTDDDAPGNRADFEQAQRTAFAAAAAEIVSSHRQIVTAANLFDPRVKPGITLRVNSQKLRATGHVVEIREEFDSTTGRAITAVDIGPFVVEGGGLGESTPIEPIPKLEPLEETDIPDRIYFPTRIGGLTNSPMYDERWTGYSTNYEHDPTDQEPFAADPADIDDRAYPNQFTVEYPEIPAQHLQSIELQAVKRIDVVIPNDELVRIQ